MSIQIREAYARLNACHQSVAGVLEAHAQYAVAEVPKEIRKKVEAGLPGGFSESALWHALYQVVALKGDVTRRAYGAAMLKLMYTQQGALGTPIEWKGFCATEVLLLSPYPMTAEWGRFVATEPVKKVASLARALFYFNPSFISMLFANVEPYETERHFAKRVADVISALLSSEEKEIAPLIISMLPRRFAHRETLQKTLLFWVLIELANHPTLDEKQKGDVVAALKTLFSEFPPMERTQFSGIVHAFAKQMMAVREYSLVLEAFQKINACNFRLVEEIAEEAKRDSALIAPLASYLESQLLLITKASYLLAYKEEALAIDKRNAVFANFSPVLHAFLQAIEANPRAYSALIERFAAHLDAEGQKVEVLALRKWLVQTGAASPAPLR